MDQCKVSRRDFLISCILGSSLSLLSSCTSAPRRVVSTSRISKGLIHRVRPSETLWSLSKRYNVSLEAIYRANGLKPEAVIEVGQELVIPAHSYMRTYSSPTTSRTLHPSEVISPPSISRVTEPRTLVTPLQVPIHSRRTVHEVGPLETVWRISRMYAVDEDEIYKANRMSRGSSISIGQKLIIPNAKVFHNVIPLYPSSKWRYIVIHHTASDMGNACLINRLHRGRGWWYGLGYHFLIDNGTMGKGDGQIEASPRWVKQQKGAHCKAGGMNHKAIGICLVGNFSKELPTRKQLHSLIYLTQTMEQGYSIRSSRILPHRGVAGARTECPGLRFPWSTLERHV